MTDMEPALKLAYRCTLPLWAKGKCQRQGGARVCGACLGDLRPEDFPKRSPPKPRG